MNITLRKLAMLEKSIAEKEELARSENGYTTNVVNTEFKKSISTLMDKVRALS